MYAMFGLLLLFPFFLAINVKIVSAQYNDDGHEPGNNGAYQPYGSQISSTQQGSQSNPAELITKVENLETNQAQLIAKIEVHEAAVLALQNLTNKMLCEVTRQKLFFDTKRINGRNYYFPVPNLKVTWKEAETICKSNYMDLVSFETKEEWEAFRPEIRQYYWSSGSDAEEEEKWKWTATGSDLTFDVGSGTKYNNQMLNCIVLDVDYFYYYECDTTMSFVCEVNNEC